MIQADAEGRLAAELRQLETLMAAMPDGLLVQAPDGRILRMNPAAQRLLGLTSENADLPPEEHMRRLRMLTMDGEPIAPEQRPAARALQGETVQDEMLILDGPPPHGPRWVSASAVPIRGKDGTVERVVATFVGLAHVQQVQQQRDVLLRTLFHDLRTPLSVLLLHAQMLQRTLPQGDRNAKRVDTIIANGQHLATMFQDLVEMVRLDSGQVHLAREPIDVAAFMKKLVERLATDRVRLSCEPNLPALLADPERLERVVVHLLSRALKSADAPSEVLLQVGRDHGAITITVTDHGVGIAREDLPHVFERFHRASDDLRQVGLGLGLPVAAMLVRAHGGRIEVESEMSKGTVFRASFPIDPVAPATK